MNISWRSPFRRQTAGTGSAQMTIVLPQKCMFCRVFAAIIGKQRSALLRPSSGSNHGSTIPGTSFCASQATAAYKCPANSPERGLERKQRGKHFHYLSYSCDSSLASLQFSIRFLIFRNWVGKRERFIVIDSGDTSIQGLLLFSLLFLSSSTCAFQFLLLIMANISCKLYTPCSYFMTS